MNASVPVQFQQWLQELYRLPPLAPVDAFLLELAPPNAETLLLREADDGLELGLCLDPDVLARVEARGGIGGFPEQTLDDFWTVLEGVSHFVCLGWHARQDREISALDLELQAEIDKFVTAWELGRHAGLGDLADEIHAQLFDAAAPAGNLPPPLRWRYHEASRLAARYCRWLRSRYGGDALGLRGELRVFFRLPPHRRRARIRHLPRGADDLS